MNSYLGIDIGGSGFKYGWGNSELGLQYFGTKALKEKSLVEFQRIASEIWQEAKSHNIKGIGIGSPGTIDQVSNKIIGVNPNLPFWTEISPAEIFPFLKDIPIFFDNDANMMALAEAHLGNFHNAIGITVGSGIGGGIVINNDIYSGSNGFAGEIGHIILKPEGETCNCGQRGCVEAYSSVDAIRRRLAQHSEHYRQFSLPDLIRVRKIDTCLNDIIEEGESVLAQAIAILVTCFDPQAIILGGGAMELGMYSHQQIIEKVKMQLPIAHKTKLHIALAQMGNKAGAMGALLYCERRMKAE